MNNLKANPKGLDVVIYGIQKKMYDQLPTLWSGVDLHGYDRCYLANRNGFKSIDYYISQNEYKNLVVAEENKFFFTAENDIKKVGSRYYKTAIDLYFILNLKEAKPPEPVKKAKGGAISSASKRADGCAIRGKTRA